MPANSRVFLKPFIGGLNTEGSDVDDMVLNTSDELNCTILPEQMRGRRYGFNIEKDGKWIDTDVTSNMTGSIYYWKNVAKTDLDILVCRISDKLYFFDAAIKPITDADPIGSVSLKDYIIDTNQFYKEKFGFAVGDGKLTVVNRWMQPVRVIYDVDQAKFVVESFTLSIRDIEGVIDSWGVKSAQKLVDELNEEPTKALTDPSWTITDSVLATAYIPYCEADGDCYLLRKRKGLDKQYKLGPLTKATVGTETHVFYDDKDVGVFQTGNDIYGGSREHYYNLLNQGWTEGDLDKFSQAMSTASMGFIWPDNTMAVNIGRDNTGAYNTGDVVYTYLGNTRQPRGHFILDYFKMNRSEVSGIWDFSNAAKATYSYQNTWVKNRHLRGVSIYNHSTTVEDSQGVASRIVLKWTKLYRKSGKKSADFHWRGNIEIKIYGLLNNEWTLITTRQAYSSDGASATDPMSVTVEIDDLQTRYDKYKVDVRYYNGNASDSAGGVPYGVTMTAAVFTKDADSGDYFYKGGDSSRVTDVAYMSGKYFYLCKDSVLFSQTVKEDGTGFDLCYQDADPTSTEVSDIVTTDGGYVKFNTMGRGLALKTFNRGVLVFGRDVVYGLISPLESRFTATEYDILELSRAGLISPESVVSTTQQVYYWSPTGIYTIGVNPETGSTIFAQSVSLNTIQTYYNNLAQFSKENCKGVYDYTSNRIYWYFPTNVDQLNNLDGCLVYDLTYNCFMPQNVTEAEGRSTLDVTEVSQSYEIEPTVYLRAGGNKVIAGEDKVLAVDETSTDYHRWTSVQHLITKHDLTGYKFSIGDFNDREFKDWEYYDYDSYLVSRPITLGDTYFNKQTPVMQTLFRRTEEYKLNKRSDEYLTTYNFKPYKNTLTSTRINSYTDVLNAGKFVKANIALDFSDFTHTISEIQLAVMGYKEGQPNTYVAFKTIQNVTSTSRYTTSVESKQEYINSDFDRFRLWVRITPSDAEDLHVVDESSSIVIERTKPEERIFKGYEELVITGEDVMNLVNTYEVGMFTKRDFKLSLQSASGKLKNATITFTPNITQASPFFGYRWEANSVSLTEGPDDIATGISNTVEPTYSVSYTLSGEPSVSATVANYDQYAINVIGFYCTGGEFQNMPVSYSITTLVPVFEEFTSVESAEYTTPSGAFIRMRWGWSVNPLSNRWDMVQNGYRPQKDFLHDDYVESRLHIRGRGKAFQVEIRNDENKDFRLTGLNIITRSPQ